MHGGPRAQVVERLRARLLEGWPRLTMAAFVAVTGATGVLASVGLRALGVSHLAARYALAVLLAYAVLVLQLRVWVLLERR
ncbi:MAG: hypothetical protein NDI82_05485, partial [Anaeromyxobacteraceae bacterium]|nr:hypothetical protein [Anaeromyxobacteraceae bacterium]